LVAVRNDLVTDEFKWTEWLDLFGKLNKRKNFKPRYLHEDIQPNAEIDKELLAKLTLKRDDFEYGKRNLPETSKPLRIGIMGKGGQGERIYSTNGHAITFSAYGGGAASKTGAYYVDGRVRKLTPTECARAMGFHGMNVNTGDVPLLQRYKQFGNSVVVNVVEAIFTEIKRHWLPEPKRR
jgi:DNA (cytosine-5)-methyltransferase 1